MNIEEEKTETPHLIPDEIKWAIVFHKKDGMSNCGTAKRVTKDHGRPISHQTVKRIWDSYQQTHSVTNQWSSEGRPKMLDEEELDLLSRSCEENRIISVKERKEDLALEASRATINKALVEMGYRAYRAREKPILTLDHRKERLQFAQKHRRWDDEDWSRVVFSDECAFRTVNSNGRLFIRRTEDDEWDEDAFQPTDGFAKSVMVWGAISNEGVGPLVRLYGRVKAEDYLDAFRHRLRRYYPNLYEGDMIFQQDNAPIHTAEITMDWFESKGIECLDWPPHSPDLNIIENVWGHMKYELRNRVFEDLEELWEEVSNLWENISTEFIESLYSSMPRRVRAIIDAKGGNTRY